MHPIAPIFICESPALVEGGKGIRFALMAGSVATTGFAVRFKGIAYGYLNRCAHVPIELDWAEGEFFESSGMYLMCSTHGAIYAPESGRCEGGPCRGGRLRPIMVSEHEGRLYWHPDDYLLPVPNPTSIESKE